VEPDSGSSSVEQLQYLTTEWSDPNGWEDLKWGFYIIGPNTDMANRVFVYYTVDTNQVYLRNDAGSGWLGGYAPSSDHVIENSQGAVECEQTLVELEGTTVTVRWAIRFKAPFVGTKNTYLKCKDDSGVVDDWQHKGTWTITEEAATTSTPTQTLTQTPTVTPTGGTSSTATRTATATSTATPSGQETTLTLQQGSNGYNGCKDTYVHQYAPTTMYRWKDLLKVGYKQQYSALVYFDLSSIPGSATISEATIQLYALGWSGSDMTVDALAVLRGTNPHQATWNQADLGNSWGVAGCNCTATDRRPVPEASVATSSIARWYSFDVTSLVQEWVGGSLANNGIVLRGPTGVAKFDFASAQRSSVDVRPKLVVAYR